MNFETSNSKYTLFIFPFQNTKDKNLQASQRPLTFQLDLPQQKMIRFDNIPTLIAKKSLSYEIASSNPKNFTSKNKQAKNN